MKVVEHEEELELDLGFLAGSEVGPAPVEGNPSENPESLAGEEKNPQVEAEKKKEVDRQVLLAEDWEEQEDGVVQQEKEKQGSNPWKVQEEQEQTGEVRGKVLHEEEYS